MFGFRKSITNEECEVAKLRGSLKGLNYRLNCLIKVSNRPDNRSDLTEEINRVEKEIERTELKLREMVSLVDIQNNNKIN